MTTYVEFNHANIRGVARPPLTGGQYDGAKLLIRWLNREISGVYLYGPVGTGKTSLAARAAETMEDLGTPTLFVKVKRTLDELRDFTDAPFFNRWSPEAVRERLCEAPALVLDDLGAARDTEYSIEELCGVLDWRYDHRDTCATLVTSNLTGSEVRERYGERLYSRISGLCVPVAVTGHDLRRRNA